MDCPAYLSKSNYAISFTPYTPRSHDFIVFFLRDICFFSKTCILYNFLVIYTVVFGPFFRKITLKHYGRPLRLPTPPYISL